LNAKRHITLRKREDLAAPREKKRVYQPRSGDIYEAHSVSCGLVIRLISSRGAAASQMWNEPSFEMPPLRGSKTGLGDPQLTLWAA
jgi:hypothetical protein